MISVSESRDKVLTNKVRDDEESAVLAELLNGRLMWACCG